MSPENDYLLTRLTIRIEEPETGLPIGSGILFANPNLIDSIYLLTAAHCFYEDKEKLERPRPEISVSVYNPALAIYQSIHVAVNHDLVSKSLAKDVAVIRLRREEVEAITGNLPAVQAIKERLSNTSFTLKGFPSATRGQEIVLTKPVFVQEKGDRKEFQLRLIDDFTTDISAESKVDGFSGSGVFLESHKNLYLYGIFTRFREAGKVIYCQYIDAINELLASAFLPTLPFTYVGEHGLTPEFFATHNATAIANLGPRFSEQLNFRLPIVAAFHDAAKDDVFQRRLSKCVDRWLLHRSYSNIDEDNGVLARIAEELNRLRSSTKARLSSIQWEADKPIDFALLLTGLNNLEQHIDEKQRELHDLQREEWRKKREQGEERKNSLRHEPEPYENELSWLRETERTIYTFKNDLSEISLTLANMPTLIIKGEPGCGKSHLLGDMANGAMKRGVATLLLLGQIFKGAQTIWQNILSQLELSCTKEELLASLNSIGKQQGTRVLIMIDALNEGPGKELWKDALAGFIEDVRRYPFIGLVLTVRTTYFNAIIPKSLQADERITYIAHEGFKGNEYEALRLFCQHYGLQTPNFPILTPEFTNPLFLQLICRGVEASGEKIFPQGFQGVTKVFNYYVDAIYKKLSEKPNNDYEHRKHEVRAAIHAFAQASYAKEKSRMLTLEEADKLFAEKFARFPHLLNDLIYENVFIQNTQTEYNIDEESEMLYFAYERFGDFFITEQLLEKYARPEDIKQAFSKEAELGKLLEEYHWRNRGILEAMAVRLPEKYNLEIVEVFEWAFKQAKDPWDSDVTDWLTSFLWDSLKWRTPSSIDDKKITAWLASGFCTLREEEYLLRLVELSTVRNHPFNGDRLFKFLNQFSMAERDGFWQAHMRYYSRNADDGNAFPIRRLIDWAWQKGVSALVDMETARLAGETLAWLFSSTVKHLRDQTSKAMVNLLEEQPDALIRIMTVFKDTDDAYIAERLYAAAYGCALRTSSDAALKKIAEYIYDSTFKNGNPPVHVLLRDYARNIIEYAHYKKLVEQMDMGLVRPPYDSKFPVLPGKQDVEQYKSKLSTINTQVATEKDRMYGQIHFSAISWDFGRYTIESAVRDFAPLSFTDEAAFKVFKKKLKGDKKYLLSAIVSNLEMQALLENIKAKGTTVMADKPMAQWKTETLAFYEQFRDQLHRVLEPDEWQECELKFIPFLQTKFGSKEYPRDTFNADPIKYWIVQRAFELGYNVDKHAQYDSAVSSHSRHEHAIERIGKKYQWIALHEIIARLGDNYYFKEGRWNGKERYSYYQGPYQHYLRDIDPIFVTKNPKEESDELDSIHGIIQKGWWFDAEYSYWNQPLSQWINNINDLPNPENIILRKDENNDSWIYLKLNTSWEEPKASGQERYTVMRKEIWYMINAYLVRKSDKQKILLWLKGKNFFGRWMPETNNANLGLFNRENYWSPASAKDRKIWEIISGSKLKVIVSTSEAVGELSEDKSGAHFRYDMPSRVLFEGLNLQYAPIDGSFKNSAGEIVVKNVSSHGVLIRKKDLLDFLAQNNYEIIWTLLGEKNALSGMAVDSENHFRAVSGVYHYDDNKVVGDFFISNRDRT